MLNYIPSIIVGVFLALTNVELIVDGKKPTSFAECPITVVVGDKEHNITDAGLPEILTQVDSFYLKGSNFLSGLATSNFATTGSLRVSIETEVPRDSLELKMACVPRTGYVRAIISNKETTRTYIMHNGKPIFTINGVKVIGTINKRYKKRNKN